MKTRLLLFSLILSCFLGHTSFAQKQKLTPIEYNDKLAALTDSLYNMGVEWGTAFQQIAGGDKDYSKLAVYRKKIATFTTRKIEEVRRGPTAGKGAEELKAAMLNFLNFEKNMVDNAFTPLEKLNSTSSQAEIDAAIQKLTAESEKESEALKGVNTAQEKFGQQNGFSIEEAGDKEE